MRSLRLKTRMRESSMVVLRLGVGIVIAWFGLQQITDPLSWVSYLPPFTENISISPKNLIYINGWFEFVFGLLLMLGFFLRTVAFFLTLHMLGIVYAVGYNEIGVRDFGVLTAVFAIFLHGPNR